MITNECSLFLSFIIETDYFAGIFPTQSLSPNEERMRCVYYNLTECLQSNGERGCGKDNQVCGEESDPERVQDHKHLCFALWNLTSGQPQLTLKGCWVGDFKSCAAIDKNRSDVCLLPSPEESKKTQKLVFCCCKGPNCNEKLHLEESSAADNPGTPLPYDSNRSGMFCYFQFFFVLFQSLVLDERNVKVVSGLLFGLLSFVYVIFS